MFDSYVRTARRQGQVSTRKNPHNPAPGKSPTIRQRPHDRPATPAGVVSTEAPAGRGEGRFSAPRTASGNGRGEAPALVRPMTSLPASIVGTTGTAARRHGHGRGEGPGACQVDDRLARTSACPWTGRRRSSAPRAARCQVDDRGTMTSLPSCPPSIGTAAGEAPALARSMTGLPAVGLPLELAGVDRRHHGRHVARSMTAAR